MLKEVFGCLLRLTKEEPTDTQQERYDKYLAEYQNYQAFSCTCKLFSHIARQKPLENKNIEYIRAYP
ncbi:MAG: hypothetical protein K0S74_1192 [Chlamydiales bacterium]|jgi:hypothetical protein|nr:hypothetical protein [Chlamydiales bacterium]